MILLVVSTLSVSGGMLTKLGELEMNIAAILSLVTSTEWLRRISSDWVASLKEITVPFSSSVERAIVRVSRT